VELRVTGPQGDSFSAVVETSPDKQRYPVRLDRLWFSALVGPAPEVSVASPGGDWAVRREGRKTGDALY
jgi:hypothetical protein